MFRTMLHGQPNGLYINRQHHTKTVLVVRLTEEEGGLNPEEEVKPLETSESITALSVH